MAFTIFEHNIDYKEVIKQYGILYFKVSFFYEVDGSEERFWPRDSDKSSIYGKVYGKRPRSYISFDFMKISKFFAIYGRRKI